MTGKGVTLTYKDGEKDVVVSLDNVGKHLRYEVPTLSAGSMFKGLWHAG